MKPGDAIYVAGHRGLVGSAIMRALEAEGHSSIITRSHAEVDLRNVDAVDALFATEKPAYVFLAAARVGGIMANSSYPVEFLSDNLRIELNVIEAAHRYRSKKLLFLGSSCIYPKFAAQPISEDALLTGALEPTNEAYALAKIAGIKLCQAYWSQYGDCFISAMPTNLYGPNDSFDLATSHVLPALIRKFHAATLSATDHVEVWGSGKPRREFLHVEDLARACLFLMEQYEDPAPINVGVGSDVSIAELAEMVREVSGFRGDIHFDTSKPDGTPRKLLDVRRINTLGWSAKIDLRDGIERVYSDYYKQMMSLGAQT